MTETRDPLNNVIKLTQLCWNSHIVKEHPEMEDFHKELLKTIKYPEYIFRSKISKNSLLYFKGYFRPEYGYFYIMTVVDYKEHKKIGFIKTAFPVYNLNKGGDLIWKK